MRRKLMRGVAALPSRFEKWRRSAQTTAYRTKQFVRKSIKPDRCVIVASNGRSGSTMTYEALLEGLRKRDVGAAKKATFIARLRDAQFSAPFLYKTHDFPDALKSGPENVRVVFCFGHTKDSTFSVYTAKDRYGPDWIRQHFYHLHATGTFNDLFAKDVLQQARQIREWTTFEGVPVLCVRYDAIWKYKDDIAKFTGLQFQPPERRAREPKQIPEELQQAASQIYDPIDKVIDALPDCFIASRSYESLVRKLPK